MGKLSTWSQKVKKSKKANFLWFECQKNYVNKTKLPRRHKDNSNSYQMQCSCNEYTNNVSSTVLSGKIFMMHPWTSDLLCLSDSIIMNSYNFFLVRFVVIPYPPLQRCFFVDFIQFQWYLLVLLGIVEINEHSRGNETSIELSIPLVWWLLLFRLIIISGVKEKTALKTII